MDFPMKWMTFAILLPQVRYLEEVEEGKFEVKVFPEYDPGPGDTEYAKTWEGDKRDAESMRAKRAPVLRGMSCFKTSRLMPAIKREHERRAKTYKTRREQIQSDHARVADLLHRLERNEVTADELARNKEVEQLFTADELAKNKEVEELLAQPGKRDTSVKDGLPNGDMQIPDTPHTPALINTPGVT